MELISVLSLVRWMPNVKRGRRDRSGKVWRLTLARPQGSALRRCLFLCTIKADQGPGSYWYAIGFINPSAGSIMAAAVHRSAMLALRQRFTFREIRLIGPTMFSMIVVHTSDRGTSGGKLIQMAVRKSSIHSRILPPTQVVICSNHRARLRSIFRLGRHR